MALILVVRPTVVQYAKHRNGGRDVGQVSTPPRKRSGPINSSVPVTLRKR